MVPSKWNSLRRMKNSFPCFLFLQMNTMAIIFQLVQRCYSLSSLEDSVATSKLTLISAAKLALARLRKYVAQVSIELTNTF